jgi:hypothetical protein
MFHKNPEFTGFDREVCYKISMLERISSTATFLPVLVAAIDAMTPDNAMGIDIIRFTVKVAMQN